MYFRRCPGDGHVSVDSVNQRGLGLHGGDVDSDSRGAPVSNPSEGSRAGRTSEPAWSGPPRPTVEGWYISLGGLVVPILGKVWIVRYETVFTNRIRIQWYYVLFSFYVSTDMSY